MGLGQGAESGCATPTLPHKPVAPPGEVTFCPDSAAGGAPALGAGCWEHHWRSQQLLLPAEFCKLFSKFSSNHLALVFLANEDQKAEAAWGKG